MEDIVCLVWSTPVMTFLRRRRGADAEMTGPLLPLEFSCVAPDGCLTLVIDEANGSPCPSWISGRFGTIGHARDEIAMAEGHSANAVGFIDRTSGERAVRPMQRHPQVLETIAAWAAARDLAAVVWSALAPNFQRVWPRRPFSVDDAIRFLEGQTAERRDRALVYFRDAPPEVQTPLRAAVRDRWPKETGG